ncbi:MAG: glycosyl hydrolase [Acidobacteria bacterium]|nr:MAG: glycosyl hydrolase [Acidobacteriota bacterium]
MESHTEEQPAGSEERIDRLIAELTLDEKTLMVTGQNAWTINGCERLGIPDWTVSDGPIGVRGRGFAGALCLPSASAWGATFDPALISEIGAAIAEEANDRAVQMVLGPTVNIHRHPLGGRHFECYSEDPLLTSRIAVAYVESVQSFGIGTCMKHFVGNDQEYQRHTMSSDIDERALREIYFPPFEAAVTDAGVWGVMGAYNYVNGVQACESRALLVDLLKDEWGFDGIVISDWGALKGTVAPAKNGLDIEMPGPGRFWGKGKLAVAVRAGEVPETDIDDKVRRILRFMEWAEMLEPGWSEGSERSVDRPEAHEVAKRAAQESIVLLKNDGGALPLQINGLSKVAIVGPNAKETCLLGGGSATVSPHRRTNVFGSVSDRLGDAVEVVYAPGPSYSQDFGSFPKEVLASDGVTLELFEGIGFGGKPFATESGKGPMSMWIGSTWPENVRSFSVRASAEITPDVSGKWRLGGAAFGNSRLYLDGELIANTEDGRFSSGLAMWGATGIVELEEGRRYELVQEVEPNIEGFEIMMQRLGGGLEPDHETPFAEAVKAASSADIAIVVVGNSAETEVEDEDRKSIALPGRQDELVSAIAAACERTIVVCNTGSPVTMPWVDAVDAILQVWYPGQEGGEAVAEVLLGLAEPGGRLPTTWPKRIEDTPAYPTYPGVDGHAPYAEGVLVGYRWYDAYATKPLWPFGHGLSYAAFEWGDAGIEVIQPEEGTPFEVKVSVPISNVSDRTGSEVVQCYVAAPSAPVARPVRELRDFAKARLGPGESQVVQMSLGARAFTRWDADEHKWVIDRGRYTIALGRSSRDLMTEVEFSLG